MTRGQRYLLLLLAATLAFAACSGVEEGAEALAPDEPQQPQAVSFDAYVNRNTTRGGYQGQLSLSTLQSAESGGFGVFAYYSDGRLYNQTSLPDFMYNQQVTYGATLSHPGWTYSPVKYWPNEAGSSDNHIGADLLTFFAYAPYTDVVPSTGRASDGSVTGIVALSRAVDSGDPIVRYYASLEPAKCVDLCWGTPQVDQLKPDLEEKIQFNFQHALSALNVQIDADIDAQNEHTNPLDGNTRVYVRSVTFEGFAMKGQLNLHSTGTVPIWNNLDCDCDLTSKPVTIYDGRRDGREGMAASLNETQTDLNPQIVQSGAYGLTAGPPPTLTSPTPGVTKNAVNLFNVSSWEYAKPAEPTDEELKAAAAAPVYVIPTNDPMRVTIVYDVETYDPKLVSQYLADGATHGSTITNTITANIKTGGTALTMQAGKKYDLRLHLGLVSVKVEAEVTPWPSEPTYVIPSADVDVPKN